MANCISMRSGLLGLGGAHTTMAARGFPSSRTGLRIQSGSNVLKYAPRTLLQKGFNTSTLFRPACAFQLPLLRPRFAPLQPSKASRSKYHNNQHSRHQILQSSITIAPYLVGFFCTICVGICAWYQMVVDPRPESGKRPNYVAAKYFRENFVLSEENLQAGRKYTLLSSTFAHKDIWHLVCNMTGLWSFGKLVAGAWGPVNFVALFLGAGLVGSLAEVYARRWRNDGIRWEGYGASAGVFGLVAACAVAAPRSRISVIFIPVPSWLGTLGTVVFSLAAIKNDWLPWMAHEAHLSGIAFGIMYYVLARRFQFKRI